MIEYAKGNMLTADAEALVNTVNCVGVMGKGIALQFKKAFPDNFKAYEKACRSKEVQPGRMFIYKTNSLINPRFIINFPTKRHWRGKSRYEDIEAGLNVLPRDVKRLGIKSIAIPPLGCGLGGLDWQKVGKLIEKSFSELPDVRVLLYKPRGAPDAKDMPVRTSKPRMTVARALFIKLIQQYAQYAYRLTLLEIQKLAYFLQEAGQPLRLNHVKHFYGPYAHNLNKVLEIMEGHFIRGYGDAQRPDVEIELLPDAVDAADRFLEKHAEEKERLERVANLIDGFETPYGMELLSSVHWVVACDGVAGETQDVVHAFKSWNNRKATLFQEKHIDIAYERLRAEGWTGVAP
ncbi:MAG: macro domain-containing protein [Desulfobacterales bacterium]|nr:macro domain-containing protein [Desulfobacterales bacterium]